MEILIAIAIALVIALPFFLYARSQEEPWDFRDKR